MSDPISDAITARMTWLLPEAWAKYMAPLMQKYRDALPGEDKAEVLALIAERLAALKKLRNCQER